MYFAFLILAAALGLGCGSSGSGGFGGTGGGGGRVQIPSEEATTPGECEFLGAGGADAVPCDYVTVDFSTPLAAAGLTVEATIGAEEPLISTEPPPAWELPPTDPALFLSLDETETLATGFTITRIAEQPHYAPAEISVVVALDGAVVADTTLAPSYTCVELTSDDWCWQGLPLTLEVSP
jgi:hypothetical protein